MENNHDASRPLVLVTNDDGIHSLFLQVLVQGLSRHFRVCVAAPASERSWIGRAISRYRKVAVEAVELKGAQEAWMIDGTPTDCVNIAMTDLLKERPVAVASGINVGFNCLMPLLFSSGTLAGAIEGSAWGIPSLAFSQFLDAPTYAAVQSGHEKYSAELSATLSSASVHAAEFVKQRLASDLEPHVIDNINFPQVTTKATVVRRTRPAQPPIGSLFRRAEQQDQFSFHWSLPQDTDFPEDTDLGCLQRGQISHTLLDYAAMAVSDAASSLAPEH